jgi:hypothetical protein
LAGVLVYRSAARRGFAGAFALQARQGAGLRCFVYYLRGFAGFVLSQAIRGAVYGVKRAQRRGMAKGKQCQKAGQAMPKAP